jgi:hypothetical protein
MINHALFMRCACARYLSVPQPSRSATYAHRASDLTALPPSRPILESLDNSKVSRFQLKIMLISGMGFFTDAYDLFVIGIVVALLKPEWSLSTGQVSLLNSITLEPHGQGPRP